MTDNPRVYVAGHRGLVGSAILRRLLEKGYDSCVTRTRSELDLLDAAATEAFFRSERPEWVFLAAAKVGGIYANNTWPADFIRDNLTVQTNVVTSAHRAGVKKLLFLGSSCIYPKFAAQPIVESAPLTGELEPTDEWYAIARIAGVNLCQTYRKQHDQ